MFKTILVPTDGSPFADKALTTAIEVANFTGGKVIGLCVAEPYPFSALAEEGLVDDPNQYEQKLRDLAQKHLDRFKATANQLKVPCETVVTTSFSPHEEIIKVAGIYHCDSIFMASHGRKGLDRLILGSETQKVLANSTIPVLVLR